MPKHAARLIAVALVLCVISCPTPLPAAGLNIFKPTREDATGAPYLHMDPNTGAYVNPSSKYNGDDWAADKTPAYQKGDLF